MGNENEQNLSPKGPWWKEGMQIFSEISTWIAVPIIVALIGGKALDKHFGTKPLMLLLSAGLAFLISAYGIVKSVKIYAAKVKKQEEKK